MAGYASPLQSASRRRALVATVVLLTIMYSWHSVQQLEELIEAEPELPQGGSLLQRAEANIASHLHLQAGVASECVPGLPPQPPPTLLPLL